MCTKSLSSKRYPIGQLGRNMASRHSSPYRLNDYFRRPYKNNSTEEYVQLWKYLDPIVDPVFTRIRDARTSSKRNACDSSTRDPETDKSLEQLERMFPNRGTNRETIRSEFFGSPSRMFVESSSPFVCGLRFRRASRYGHLDLWRHGHVLDFLLAPSRPIGDVGFLSCGIRGCIHPIDFIRARTYRTSGRNVQYERKSVREDTPLQRLLDIRFA